MWFVGLLRFVKKNAVCEFVLHTRDRIRLGGDMMMKGEDMCVLACKMVCVFLYKPKIP